MWFLQEWSLGASSQGSSGAKEKAGNRREKKSKGKHFEQVKLQDGTSSAASTQPEFLRKRRHTPATIPRTKFSAGTPLAERMAMAKICQQLQFDDDDQEVSVVSFHKHFKLNDLDIPTLLSFYFNYGASDGTV